MPTISKQVAAPRKVARPSANGKAGASVLDRIAPVGASKIGRLKVSVYGMPKCLGRGTPVLMFDGSIRAVEDIVAGDQLMGPDSLPRTVEETATGIGPLYRIIPIKGDSWVCNDEHVLTLAGTVNFKGQTRDVSVKEYLAEQYEGHLSREHPSCDNWRLLRAGIVEFPEQQPLDVPPYLVGLWMGDGKRGGVEIGNGNPIVHKACQEIADKLGMQCRVTLSAPEKNSATIYLSAKEQSTYSPGRKGCNLLRTFFVDECEVGCVKTIPKRYLTASVADRRRLLAGILDTDGKTTGTSFTMVTVTGEPYRDSLLFLCRSLGIASYCTESQVHVCANGKVSTYYAISISGDLESLPTRVKKFAARRQVKRVNVVGFEIEDAGEGEYFGFTIDRDGRFLLGDFTVTHNTGKTRFATLFPKPALILGTEDGTASIVGTKGVDFVKLKTCDELREVIEDQVANQRYATYILDNGTGLREMRITELWQSRGMAVPERKPFLFAGSDWKAVWVQCSHDLKEILNPFLDLPNRIEANVIVIAQEQNFTEDGATPIDGGLPIKPAIGSALGKSLSIWLNAECDYVCQTFIRQQEIKEPYKNTQGKVVPGKFESLLTGEKEFCLRVGPHETYVTGFRQAIGAPKLPDVIVDPTYEKIVELIQKK